ncbi:MAG TPA: DUF3047 domain-containing protein [Candidatus Methylomirabilis sp.]|nr:DUF3047 domain-containing protein [Candidatus Methylomirabilis sp.]
MRSRSGAVVVAVAALIVVCLSSALVSRSTPQVEDIVVQDWTAQPLGSTGVPVGWSAYETFGGRPRYDFAVVEDDGRRALDLRSRDDHSTIVKKIHVDLRTTPILEWSWKMVALPAGADIRKKSTSDLSGHIFVVWPRLGMLRARLIGYAWGTAEPAPSVERSRKTGAVTFFVLRSGPKDLHRWMNERRNVYADYRTAFGEDPDDARAVALSIDTNDTHSTAEALIGRIAFTAGQ